MKTIHHEWELIFDKYCFADVFDAMMKILENSQQEQRNNSITICITTDIGALLKQDIFMQMKSNQPTLEKLCLERRGNEKELKITKKVGVC